VNRKAAFWRVHARRQEGRSASGERHAWKVDSGHGCFRKSLARGRKQQFLARRQVRKEKNTGRLGLARTVAWPAYDWMGVSKAALESLARYLARDLGADRVRVNLVAAGPVKTMAAKSIPGFTAFEDTWAERAPLGWDVLDTDVVARACLALLSDLLPMTTGEILHVDGGVHAMGA